MTTFDAKQIAQAVIEEIKNSEHVFWIDPEVHASQHEFIAELIAERHERKERRKRVDHCHTTDKVRGLICSPCNSLLGYSKDNTKTLQNAIKYLKEFYGEDVDV